MAKDPSTISGIKAHQGKFYCQIGSEQIWYELNYVGKENHTTIGKMAPLNVQQALGGSEEAWHKANAPTPPEPKQKTAKPYKPQQRATPPSQQEKKQQEAASHLVQEHNDLLDDINEKAKEQLKVLNETVDLSIKQQTEQKEVHEAQKDAQKDYLENVEKLAAAFNQAAKQQQQVNNKKPTPNQPPPKTPGYKYPDPRFNTQDPFRRPRFHSVSERLINSRKEDLGLFGAVRGNISSRASYRLNQIKDSLNPRNVVSNLAKNTFGTTIGVAVGRALGVAPARLRRMVYNTKYTPEQSLERIDRDFIASTKTLHRISASEGFAKDILLRIDRNTGRTVNTLDKILKTLLYQERLDAMRKEYEDSQSEQSNLDTAIHPHVKSTDPKGLPAGVSGGMNEMLEGLLGGSLLGGLLRSGKLLGKIGLIGLVIDLGYALFKGWDDFIQTGDFQDAFATFLNTATVGIFGKEKIKKVLGETYNKINEFAVKYLQNPLNDVIFAIQDFFMNLSANLIDAIGHIKFSLGSLKGTGMEKYFPGVTDWWEKHMSNFELMPGAHEKAEAIRDKIKSNRQDRETERAKQSDPGYFQQADISGKESPKIHKGIGSYIPYPSDIFGPINPDSPEDVANGPIGKIIGGGESRNDYNVVNGGEKYGYQAFNLDLENMTIDQVRAAQAAGKFKAAGRFQVMPGTLDDAIKTMGLSGKEMFNKSMQDRIFNEFLTSGKRPAVKNYLYHPTFQSRGEEEQAMFAAKRDLALEFGSVADPKTGQTALGPTNKASIGSSMIERALRMTRDSIQAHQSERAVAKSKATASTTPSGESAVAKSKATASTTPVTPKPKLTGDALSNARKDQQQSSMNNKQQNGPVVINAPTNVVKNGGGSGVSYDMATAKNFEDTIYSSAKQDMWTG